jgi:lipopolysaccharide export LptBFGC system permease protein LptF
VLLLGAAEAPLLLVLLLLLLLLPPVLVLSMALSLLLCAYQVLRDLTEGRECRVGAPARRVRVVCIAMLL